MFNKIIEKGKEIVSLEIEGIKKLRDSLGEEFARVVDLIYQNKNRGSVIVTGMGKSGHIATKIAATLASTGTQAIFVHPAEALHGDLGMIKKQDIVIAISNSGNTLELNGIINYCLRFSIPLVAITSNADSDLARAANYILLLPNAKEACSLGLAPTTSTTNTLVLGDALAITLLDIKGFSADDFRIFHPGGSLGAKLVSAIDVMHKEELPLIRKGVLMKEAIITITSFKFGCLGVLEDNGDLKGIITDGDIRRNMDDDFLNKKVEDIMTCDFISITRETNTSVALLMMNEKKITSLFVLEEKKPIGIIHIHDLINLGVI